MTKVIRSLMFYYVILMYDHILKDWLGLNLKGGQILEQNMVVLRRVECETCFEKV